MTFLSLHVSLFCCFVQVRTWFLLPHSDVPVFTGILSLSSWYYYWILGVKRHLTYSSVVVVFFKYVPYSFFLTVTFLSLRVFLFVLFLFSSFFPLIFCCCCCCFLQVCYSFFPTVTFLSLRVSLSSPGVWLRVPPRTRRGVCSVSVPFPEERRGVLPVRQADPSAGLPPAPGPRWNLRHQSAEWPQHHAEWAALVLVSCPRPSAPPLPCSVRLMTMVKVFIKRKILFVETILIDTRTNTRRQAGTHVRTHARILTHTRLHTHTHKHTHTHRHPHGGAYCYKQLNFQNLKRAADRDFRRM